MTITKSTLEICFALDISVSVCIYILQASKYFSHHFFKYCRCRLDVYKRCIKQQYGDCEVVNNLIGGMFYRVNPLPYTSSRSVIP